MPWSALLPLQNPHTIVVLENGGPVAMPRLEQVPAVLEAWFPGQRGGEAIASILFGDVNPSGKLPLTFPKSVTDLPRPQIPFFAQATPTVFDVDYSEGFLVGYKWYNAKNITPEFPFGYGQSYSRFSFSRLSVPEHRRASGGEPIELEFDVTNRSDRAGAEVAQVYIGFPAAAGEAPKRLVSWAKVYLEPYETRRVRMDIDPDSSSHPLSIWNQTAGAWEIAAGEYTVYVGDSSRDIQLTQAFSIAR